MPVAVRPCTYAELASAPNFAALLELYGDESAVHSAWRPAPQHDVYLQLEAAGVLHALAAYRDDVLVGFLSILITVLPHFGRRTAVTESYFVDPAHRKSGAGMALLHAAERLAAKLGAEGLLVSAPFEGPLDHVLGSLASYRSSNRVYFKELAR